MNTNFQITTQTFKSLHEPLQLLKQTCLFTKLFKCKNNKVIKRKVFETKKEWLTWKNSITQELFNQRILSSKYPGKILTILNYTVETTNHQRNLFITYDCGEEIEPLFQYLNNNPVSFQEQAQIFEQLLQITCILFKSQFEHTNLKPNNILYNKKQVLITDFGSARTHYQNFLKEYTAQAEKEWQNNLIFFYPQEYQKIMEEENFDFRNDQWKDFDISNQKFRKRIDIWALSMMMIQVFENNQKLPNKLTDYYGLNKQLLEKKIDNLKQYSAGIFSEAISSLIIDKKEPDQVYQKFLKQKQMVNMETPYMESTFTIKQIFDHINDDDNILPSYKPENYFLAKKDIENLQDQFDDDASSVISSNYQIDIIGFTEIKPKNNLTQIPNLLPPPRSQSATTRQKPQTQEFQLNQNNNHQIFEFPDKESEENNKSKKRTIIVSNYDYVKQQNQGNSFDDLSINNNHKPFNPIQSELQIQNDNPSQLLLKKLEDFDDNNKQPITNNNNNQQSGLLQIIQLEKIDDDDEFRKDSNNQSPNFNQNETSTFQFLEAQKLNTFNENDNQQKKNGNNNNQFENFQFNNKQNQNLIGLEDEQQVLTETGKFVGQQQQQTYNQQINLITIDDFDAEGPKIPIEHQKDMEIIKPGQKESNLLQLDDDTKQQQTNTGKFIPKQEDLIIQQEQKNQVQSIVLVEGDKGKFNFSQPPSQIVFLDEEEQKLIQITENDDKIQEQNNNKTQKSSIIHFDNNDKQFQPIKSIQDSDEIIDEQNKNNPYSLNVIKNKLNEGVTQLQDQDQQETLGQLKLIQKILTKIIQHITDPTEIFDNDEQKQKEKQIQQIIGELVQQNENEQVILIQDINEGVESIIQNQQVFQNIDINLIQNNLILLNILNEDQLYQVKQKIQGNKIITDQIDKLIEVKDNLKKLKKDPNLKNLLKPQQIELLNKEELKIYKRLLEIMPKDRRQGDKILIQQSAVNNRLNQIQQKEQEELVKQKLNIFFQNPSYDKLLSNDDLILLNDDQKQKYKTAIEDLLLKVQQRQKQSIKEQIDILNKYFKKKPQPKKIIQEDNNNKQINQNFQDAYMQIMKTLGDEVDGDLLSLNKYIREFQQTSVNYQITDKIPDDCQKYQQQKTKRIAQFYDFQGSKYKGETLQDQPDGIGILRKMGVSSIYKGFFKQGKFVWGQVLEMNDQGQLTQYVGYYHQQHQVKNGKARLKWFQPQKIGLCGGYYFNDYEIYEGDFVLGYIHGKGKKIYVDQSEYEGDWKKNKRAGQGKYTLKKEGKKTITYEGQFQDDAQHGKDIKAIHHHQTGLDLVVEGEYRNGKPIGQHILIFNKIPQRQIDY